MGTSHVADEFGTNWDSTDVLVVTCYVCSSLGKGSYYPLESLSDIQTKEKRCHVDLGVQNRHATYHFPSPRIRICCSTTLCKITSQTTTPLSTLSAAK
jgi:hypothetical protein